MLGSREDAIGSLIRYTDWYVRQLPAQDLSMNMGISRRQCFRRRARALKILQEESEGDQVAALR